MQMSNQISPAILAGAVGLLQPFVPELSPQKLVKALKSVNEDSATGAKDPTEFLTIRQAAALLQVSRPTLYRIIKDGKLSIVKASRKSSRIPADAVRAFLANGGYLQEGR